MELVEILTGSLLWATLFSIALFIGGSVATNYLARKSKLLKPIASGLTGATRGRTPYACSA